MLTSEEGIKARWEKCSACPRLMGPLCGVCKCVLAVKIRLKHAKCPIDQWGPERGNTRREVHQQ